ncbi:MAG TPA: sulfatase-like hydrolase/transferase, partial [Acidobacteriota bacterium]|nr:sulfatase-like hydrolase/transferase [Acidobacteriota bacterium]
MKKEEDDQNGISRRKLLKSMAAGAALAATIGGKHLYSQPEKATSPKTAQPIDKPYNILFILTDQERYFHPGELPEGYRLPAHERLVKQGMVFENHRINSCVCTPSRSVLYTGQHIQHTKMFDNTNFPWIKSMSTDIKTVGHLLRDAGYFTAYKGKWHLTKEFEEVNKLGDEPTKIFTSEMEAYGFSDYFGVGDIIAHTQGGYLHDGIISAMATTWLRGRGSELTAQGKP